MLCLGAALFVFSQTARAQYTPAPIGLTGWNAEIIAANNAPGPSAGTTSDLEYGYAFYEQGAPGSSSPGGFPTNNKLTSESGLMAMFQIQPYNGDNALVLGGTAGYPGTNTLTLTTPCHFYNYVEFLVEGVDNPTWEVTLNFSDGSTSTYKTSDPDWTQGGPGAATLDAVTQSSSSWGGASYYTYVYLQEHDIPLAPCESAKTVTSITFIQSGGSAVAIFAVDAQTNNAPPPPPTTNGPIILDNFDGVNDTQGTPLVGLKPAEVDLPGGVYLANQWSIYGPGNFNGNAYALTNQIATNAIWGTNAPMALYGFDNWSGISIASDPGVGYSKPTHFHISANLTMGSMYDCCSSADTLRGWFLGFTAPGGPNGWIGYEGADNIHGLWLSFNSLYIGSPWAVYLMDGINGDVGLGASQGIDWGGTNYLLAYLDQNLLGPNNFHGWYTLAYDVDTVNGTITNITLTAMANGHTQQIPNVSISGKSASGFSDANTMVAFAGTSDGATASTGVAGMTGFTVVGLPAVHHTYPAQPTPANILFDEFNNACGSIGGYPPDTVNLPGGVWSAAAWSDFFGNVSMPVPSADASSGNPPPEMTGGANGQAWVPISSNGGYTEPTVLTISADIDLGSFIDYAGPYSSDTAVRGIMLGFCSGYPTNHYLVENNDPKGETNVAGYEGADNFAGLWLDPVKGDLYLQQFNNSYLGKPGNAQAGSGAFSDVTNITPILLFSSSTNLGPFNANSWYHLSYQVDTTSGIITNVTLSNNLGTNTAAGSFQIYSNTWSSDPGAVTLSNAFTYAAVQFNSYVDSLEAHVDNFGVSGAVAVSPFRIISVVRSGNDIQLKWTATGGQTNDVQRSASLSAGSFVGISGNLLIPGSGVVTNSYTDVGGATHGAEYYRVQLVQ